MRLRYLHIYNLPPIEDVAVTFGYEQILGRKCAIHFVVGVNGSGKTRLLQALCEIFLSLEGQSLPAFPVTLAYDLGANDTARTIYLYYPPDTSPSEAVFIEFPQSLPLNTNWEDLEEITVEEWNNGYSPLEGIKPIAYQGDKLPGVGSITAYLPKVLLAYTSGATEAWSTLFSPRHIDLDDLPETIFNQVDPEQERPLGWDFAQEISYQRQESLDFEPGESDKNQQQAPVEDLRTSNIASICRYVSPKALKLAFFAVAIYQARQDFNQMPTQQAEQNFITEINQSLTNNVRMPGLRGLLNTVDWLWPVTVSLQILLKPERLTKEESADLDRLYQIASSVVRQSNLSDRRQLIFDLRRTSPDEADTNTTTAAALIQGICGRQDQEDNKITPFDIFDQLLKWQQEGLLEDIHLTLRKRNVDDLLLYDWLSDGERLFLGRMALFQLLAGKDDALVILDEPETHFNDVWKREIVDVIDTSLCDNSTEVLISTHSSIALTDVFDTEITLLQKEDLDGSIAVVKPRIRSFGASPNEIMIDIFGSRESVGKRATEFLDLVLMLAAHPDQVQTVWELNDDRTIILTPEFQQLRGFVQELPHQYGDGNVEQLNEQILRTLKSIRQYTQMIRKRGDISVTDTVEVLQEKIGPGYYEFEFRRRLRALRERKSNVS